MSRTIITVPPRRGRPASPLILVPPARGPEAGRGARPKRPAGPKPPVGKAAPARKPAPAPQAPGKRKAAPKTRAPAPPPPAAEAEGRPLLDLLQAIRAGEVDPGCLSPETRRSCVRHLGAEGLSVPEIAQFLRCSDRTVTRDRRTLQEEAALEPDPALAGRMAGQLLSEATLCTERIRRVTRAKDTPPGVKVEGERHCFEIARGTVATLQSLGYLPSAARQLQAELTHFHGELPGYEELSQEAKRIESIARELVAEGDPVLELVAGLSQETQRALIATELSRAGAQLASHGAALGPAEAAAPGSAAGEQGAHAP